MFTNKNVAPAEQGGEKKIVTPAEWTRKQQENPGDWDAYFGGMVSKLVETTPLARPPSGSSEHSQAEDDSIVKTYWITYRAGIVQKYRDEIARIDIESQTALADRRMNEKAKAMCLESARKYRETLLQQKTIAEEFLADAVRGGKAHLAQVVSPHHRALEAAVVNFPDEGTK